MEIESILPKDGPAIEEVKKYLKKYNKETIIIKCGGSVLSNPKLFEIFIQDISILKKLNFKPYLIHVCLCPIILGGGRSSFIQNKDISINNLKSYDPKHYNMGNDVLFDLKV